MRHLMAVSLPDEAGERRRCTSMGVFREQAFVERCHCEAPAVTGCGACGRARCARHLERGLCNRCTQFVDRELEVRSVRPWVSGAAVGSVGTLALLVSGAAGLCVLAMPVGIVAGVVHRWMQRRRLIRKMGPALAASKGELPAAPREPLSFPPADRKPTAERGVLKTIDYAPRR